MNGQDRSDAELMAAIGRRDADALAALYDRYARLVFSTAFRVLHDAAAAEDVVQDVYVRLWQRPDRYVESRGKFLGWLLSVTRNRAIDEIRARGRRPLNEATVGDPTTPGALADDYASEEAGRAFESADLIDQREAVRRALTTLPPDQRIAIELAYYKGLTQAEIAQALDTPLGTIKTRIRLGMRKLRDALIADGAVSQPGAAAERSPDRARTGMGPDA